MSQAVVEEIAALVNKLDWVMAVSQTSEGEIEGIVAGPEEYVLAMVDGVREPSPDEDESVEEIEVSNRVRSGNGARRLVYLGNILG